MGMLSGMARVTKERISASRGQDIRKTGFQKHVVERIGFANPLKSLHLRHYQLHSAACWPRYDPGMSGYAGEAIGFTVESEPIGRVGGGR